MPDWPPTPESQKTEVECLKGNHDLPFPPKQSFGNGISKYEQYQCTRCKKMIYKKDGQVISANEYNNAYKALLDMLGE